ncbi:hypothetical protein SUGI_0122210 [Cryptomeria japonica]|nr:hypothetical protein SUGI_0122210 [Cryptomeria japonica]
MALICLHLHSLTFFALYFIIAHSGQATVNNKCIRASSKIYHHYDTATDTVFNVLDYGAVGDGQHDDSKAFGQAWEAACKTSSATLLVPSNKTFLVNNLAFEGQCEPGLVFQVDGMIIAPEDPEAWESKDVWLLFEHLNQFTLTGNGVIDGQGSKWWDNHSKQSASDDRPTAIHFNGCTELAINGLHVSNSPRIHFALSECDRVQMVGVEIMAPEDSPNTDGIDVFTSRNIVIEDCIIGTGDDCIAIGNGALDIVIKDVTCGPGHGISIGSLGKDDSESEVRSVQVDGAIFKETQNGLRIKTWQGGSGMARDIIFGNVQMVNAENPIIIDQYYCDSPDPCQTQSSAVQVSNVTYKSISGTSASQAAIKLDCSHSNPCKSITLSDVSLTLPSGDEATSECQNAQGQSIGTVNPSGCFSSV